MFEVNMKSLKRILLITALFGTLASSLTAMQSSNWVKFAPPGGGFSVMMPREPQELAQTPVAGFTSHVYGEAVDGVVYVCLYGDYDPSVHLNPEEELAANRDNFLKAVKAALTATKKIELDGRAGLEFSGENAQSTYQSQVYILGNRVFQIAVELPKGAGDAANASRFLKSFAFTDTKEHGKP